MDSQLRQIVVEGKQSDQWGARLMVMGDQGGYYKDRFAVDGNCGVEQGAGQLFAVVVWLQAPKVPASVEERPYLEADYCWQLMSVYLADFQFGQHWNKAGVVHTSHSLADVEKCQVYQVQQGKLLKTAWVECFFEKQEDQLLVEMQNQVASFGSYQQR